ncbi:MAG: S41 family peptidase [Alistipes sp.]
MKIKIWLFAALFAAAGMASCSDDKTVEEPITPPDPKPEINEVAVNKAVDGYMKSHYLWNAEYKTLTPDFNLDYDKFLRVGLDGVAAQNKANKEDGYTMDGKHYYYSYITRNDPRSAASMSATRAGDVRFGYGLSGVVPGNINGNIYIGILGVIDGSPAAKADLSRGTYITQVDGVAITQANYDALYKKLFPKDNASVQLKIASVIPDANNKLTVTSKGTKTLKAGRYEYNPILFATVATSKSDASLKVGYLVYNQFMMDYDEALIGTFKAMTNFAEGALSDLILDLRYNQGGHLISSTVLGTLVAGESKNDQIFCATEFNAERMKKEKGSIYKIGNTKTPEITYPLMAQALANAVNLKRIYVLTGPYTASASELIINGLRGLDIEVRLIGDKTNGKNVGMEGVGIKGEKGYTYDFYPITMRLKNAKDFSDYSAGFQPDILVEDSDSFVIGAYGSAVDPLFGYAFSWIKEGKKPEISSTRATPIAVGEPRIIEPLYKGSITSVKTL